MKKLLKRIFYRGIDITEWSSITMKELPHEKVALQINNDSIDITAEHWVLCLHPIVFGIWIDRSTMSSSIIKNTAQLIFSDTKNGNSKTTAEGSLSLVDRLDENDGSLLLWKLESSRLHHISGFEANFLFSRYYKKPGFLFDQFKAIATAYSYPRRVRLISFRDDNYFNIFPMDLLGKAGNNGRYVFGLRHTNQALPGMIEARRMLVSEVPADHKNIIYQLGKHHSEAPPALDALPFSTIASNVFNFPVPAFAEKYNELRIERTQDLGSHMLIWAQSENEEILSTPQQGVYHIHFLQHLFQHRWGNSYSLV